jgi:hypothetical protein
MKDSRPSNPYLEVYWRVDYMLNGNWYFRKFPSKAKALSYVAKKEIQHYTLREDDGSLLGGT